MDNNYIKLSTGDVIQTDDIIHISRPYYRSKEIYCFSILYAGQERVVIEYEYAISNKKCKPMESDLKLIYEKIGLNS